MAFSAYLNNEKIFSFRYLDYDWNELKKSNNQFKMPCCNAEAIPKTSKLGTKFFSHKPKSVCGYNAPETIEHQFCKYLVAKSLHDSGWSVETEKKGKSPKGDNWIADIYAEKNESKLIVEIQWSNQTIEDTEIRDQIYKNSGIKCLWLMRKTKVKNDIYNQVSDFMRQYNKNCHTLLLFKDEDQIFKIGAFKDPMYSENNDLHFRHTFIELTQGITELFEKKTIKKVSTNHPALYFRFSYVDDAKCWKCGRKISLILGGNLAITYKGQMIPIKKMEIGSVKNNQALAFVNAERYALKMGEVKFRKSKTDNSSYLSNGCFYCSTLQGKHFLNEILYNKRCYSDYIKLEKPINLKKGKSYWFKLINENKNA